MLAAANNRARFPKTPLRINDENQRGKSAKPNLVTPGPRTARAPLGNKTTNAKARTGQQTGGGEIPGKEVDGTTVKPTTTARPKQVLAQNEALKLEMLADKAWPEEEDVEYAPPQAKDLAYESDVFPSGLLSYEPLKPENMFKGYYRHYFNPLDENGMSRRERQVEEQKQQAFMKGDEQILRDMDEFDWSIGDVPNSKQLLKKKREGPKAEQCAVGKNITIKRTDRQPPTIASRRAASALAMPSKLISTQTMFKRPLASTTRGKISILPGTSLVSRPGFTKKASMEQAAALARSRTTLGYTRGRSVSSVVNGPGRSQVVQPERSDSIRQLSRANSGASTGAENVNPPACSVQKAVEKDVGRKLGFLSIFDVDEDDDGNLSGLPEFDDDNFQL